MRTAELGVELDGMKFLECPRWHEGRLYFADFYRKAVYALNEDRTLDTIVEVPNRPGGIGWLPDGRLLVVSQGDRKLYRQEADGQLVLHADLSGLAAGSLNEMAVSSEGHAYVGNMGFEVLRGAPFAPAPVIHVTPDGSASIATEPLAFPNGTVFSPDGKTLIVAETMNNRLSAFDIHSDGSLGQRRDWAVFGPTINEAALPDIIAKAVVGADGLAMATDGTVWIADAYHNRLLHVAEGGKILDAISTGDDMPFAVALGGAQEKPTLYACTAPGFDEAEREATELSRLLSTPVAVGGFPA